MRQEQKISVNTSAIHHCWEMSYYSWTSKIRSLPKLADLQPPGRKEAETHGGSQGVSPAGLTLVYAHLPTNAHPGHNRCQPAVACTHTLTGRTSGQERTGQLGVGQEEDACPVRLQQRLPRVLKSRVLTKRTCAKIRPRSSPKARKHPKGDPLPITVSRPCNLSSERLLGQDSLMD